MRALIFFLTLFVCYSAIGRGIDNVRLRTEDMRARIVFDLQEKVNYKAFRMSNPERVVIDIENIAYPKSLSLPESETEAVDGFKVLAGLRYAVRNDSGLRIVLDLKDRVALQHTALPPRQDYGHRLVVDLYRPAQSNPSPATQASPTTTKKIKPRPGDAENEGLQLATKLKQAPVKDDEKKVLAILNAENAASPARAESASAGPEVTPPKASSTIEQAPRIANDSSGKDSLENDSKPQVIAATENTPKRSAVDKPPRDVVIAIDAGHGGHDVGAIGPKGTYEKNIVLQISKELAATINKQHGLRAILTRGGDEYVALRERMNRARRQEADLFISIHADAFRDRRVRGSSVYVLSQHGASSEAARWLAENENAADLVGGVSLGDKDAVVKSVLIDLSQTASIDASIDAADTVLAALKKIGKVHKPTVQHAGFMVLKSPDIPSLLVETAFISNPTEEARLRSRSYQRKLARALTKGIVHYFNENPLPETRFAENYQRQHRVSRGDTLSEIAERYAVSMESIKLANEMSRDRVRTGEILTIP